MALARRRPPGPGQPGYNKDVYMAYTHQEAGITSRYNPSGGNGSSNLGAGTPFAGLGGLTTEEMAYKDAEGSWKEGIAEGEGNERAYGGANPFSAYRKKYASKLDEFMDDPNSITQTPGYKFALEQGTTALNRTSAAKGLRLSGNALLEAQEFGQGLASQMRQSEIDNLGKMAGVGQFGGGDYAVKSATAALSGINKGMATIGAEKAGAVANAPSYSVRSKTKYAQPAPTMYAGGSKGFDESGGSSSYDRKRGFDAQQFENAKKTPLSRSYG